MVLLVLCSITGLLFPWKETGESFFIFSAAARPGYNVEGRRQADYDMTDIKFAVLRDVQAHLDWNFKFDLDKEAWQVVTNPLLTRVQKDQKILRLLDAYCLRAFDHAMSRMSFSPDFRPIPLDVYISRTDKILTVRHMLHPDLFQTIHSESEWFGPDRTLVRDLRIPSDDEDASSQDVIPRPQPEKGPRWSQMNVRFVDNQVRKGVLQDSSPDTEDDEVAIEVQPFAPGDSDEVSKSSWVRPGLGSAREPFWRVPRNQALLLVGWVVGWLVLRATAGRRREFAKGIEREGWRQRSDRQQRLRQRDRQGTTSPPPKSRRTGVSEVFGSNSPVLTPPRSRLTKRRRSPALDEDDESYAPESPLVSLSFPNGWRKGDNSLRGSLNLTGAFGVETTGTQDTDETNTTAMPYRPVYSMPFPSY